MLRRNSPSRPWFLSVEPSVDHPIEVMMHLDHAAWLRRALEPLDGPGRLGLPGVPRIAKAAAEPRSAASWTGRGRPVPQYVA